MKKITRIVFALLFVAGALGNVFAGGGSQHSQSGGTASNMPANDGPLEAYPRTLEITVPLSIGPNVFYAQGESIEKKLCYRF
ncbi:hypothetical protein FACS189444_4600 [Spirochaetia bacterium]|nr:hypothetical protein FACS189444_4600 [Spirochaetia bacterium]